MRSSSLQKSKRCTVIDKETIKEKVVYYNCYMTNHPESITVLIVKERRVVEVREKVQQLCEAEGVHLASAYFTNKSPEESSTGSNDL